MSDINVAKPIGMLDSGVFTIVYKPDYDNELDAACNTPDPVTVVVPSMFLEKFCSEVGLVLNLEEYLDLDEESDIVGNYIDSYKGYCPHIVNAMYIDYAGMVSVIDINCLDNFPSGMTWTGR